MDSGFAHDDEYNVYDKPWKGQNSLANQMYRPSKNLDQDNYGADLEKLKSTSRFVPDKEFSGTDRTGSARSGPVQFEKEEEDPFGLSKLLKQAKGTSSSGASSKRKDDDRDERESKKRKH
ncbi:hypothetical protein TKK_0009098 [Trichogramma kaykai]|uniref:Uncharacterized protein n=1 Tax=Trichogramma kaykai TaxID=54128 RepID=A0ABD2X3V3_9HYME